MKIRTDIQQGSLEWLVARAGLVTASEFDQLLTPEFEIRKGEMVKTHLARKVAEKWLGGPLPGFSSLDMEFGKIREEEALPWYELEFGETIQRVALVTNDEGTVGASPDGLIGEDGGIELKCPEPTAHVKYLLDGDVPKEYRAQVHGSMFVTGRAWWKFVSYRRHFPPVVLTVFRDEMIQAAIREALALFLPKLDRAMEMLRKAGGRPDAAGEPRDKPSL